MFKLEKLEMKEQKKEKEKIKQYIQYNKELDEFHRNYTNLIFSTLYSCKVENMK